jgi:hypothetical protein
MSKNVLVIGTYSAEGVDSFNWFQELPYLPDYDTIILDTTKIFNFWSLAGRVKHLGANRYKLSKVTELDEKIESNILLVRKKLIEILEFQATIYALYSPEINVDVTDEKWVGTPEFRDREPLKEFTKTNDWCPISISTVSERGGRKINVIDDSYKEYFKDFKGWEYYFVPDSLEISKFESYYHPKWKAIPHLDVIATNRIDKPIAINFYVSFHSWAKGLEDSEGSWYQVPGKYGGSLTLLPTIDKHNTEPLIEILLQRGKELEVTPPPSWVNAITIPGEASLQTKIDTEKHNLETIESRMQELQSSLSELQKYKRLLYDTGPLLQDICKSALHKLGAKTKPSIVTDEFIIEVNGKEAMIEVKGNTKSIAKDDVAQLVTDLMEHLKTTGQEIQGILIGNGWRLQPLEKRDMKDKPIFSRDAKRVAHNHNIGLISTTELFKAHCKALEEPQHKTEILNKIISGKDVIKL